MVSPNGTSPGPRPRPRTRRGRAVLSLAVQALAVAALIGAWAGYRALRQHVEESPRFCQSCHEVAPEIALWVDSEHREVRCQQCHHQTLEDGLRILMTTISGGVPEGEHAPVRVASCAGCHASHDKRWPSIANSSGHVVHAERAGLACTVCHGKEMHFDRPARDTCVGCHQGQKLGSAHEEKHCLACHDFLSAGEVIKPHRQDCLRCHRSLERPVVIPEDAPMQFECAACHRPHTKTGLVACADCHPSRELVGLHRTEGHGRCLDCHAPHGWTSERAQCAVCHRGLASHHPSEPCVRCHSFEAGLGTGPR